MKLQPIEAFGRDFLARLDVEAESEPGLFNDLALELFRHQARHNALYGRFLAGLRCDPAAVCNLEDIPALPIAFFKSHTVLLDAWVASTQQKPFPGYGQPLLFRSSGTTALHTSRHWVPDAQAYEEAFLRGFRRAYGDPASWTFLFLLPSYLEREGSSLIYMCRELAARSHQPESGFFLHEHEALLERAASSLRRGQPTLLLGVSFALLDLAGQAPDALGTLPNRNKLTVVETGGMKGRRREMVRDELHDLLCRSYGVSAIHREYGMTELLSQAWSAGKGQFRCPPWMAVRIRDLNDPLSPALPGVVGALDVIDLANAHSCAFIATDDLGRLHPDGSFEVLGRLEASDVRGCNLLVS